MGSPPCTMKLLIITLLAAAVSAAPDLSQMTCEECTAEMHKLGGVVKGASPYIENYLINNYCPTLPEDDHACDYDLSMHYTEMLYAVTEHYFVDGATHICQAWGMCHATRRFTCEECVEGLEWVVAHHFPPMHAMAMEHFWHPQQACNQLPICGGD